MRSITTLLNVLMLAVWVHMFTTYGLPNDEELLYVVLGFLVPAANLYVLRNDAKNAKAVPSRVWSYFSRGRRGDEPQLQQSVQDLRSRLDELEERVERDRRGDALSSSHPPSST